MKYEVPKATTARSSFWPTARAAAFVAGYIFLFQVSGVSSTLKIAFVAFCIVLALLSANSVHRRLADLSPDLLWSAKLISYSAWLMVGFMVLQSVTLITSDATTADWVRDALNYIMLPAAMMLGLDWGTSAKTSQVRSIAIIIGLVGGASFSTAWLQKRGGDSSSFEQFGLASSFIVFGGICLCLAMYVAHQHSQIKYLVLALVQMGLVMLSGGRSGLLYFSAIILIAIAISPLRLAGRMRVAFGAVIASVLAFLVVVVVSDSIGGGVVSSRLSWFTRLGDSGVDAIVSDGSGIERARAYSWLTDIWQMFPIFGQGLGHTFPSVTTGLYTAGNYTLDSPIVVLAKFGLLGTLVLTSVLVLFFVGIIGSRRSRSETLPVARTFAILCLFLTLFLTVNGFPLENRGFGIFALVAVAVATSLRAETKALTDLGLPSGRTTKHMT